MNTHTGTLTRVEARRTIAHRRRQWVAVLRAAMHPEDVERLRADAKLAVEQLAPGSYFQSAALRVLEVAHLLAGNEGAPDVTAGQVKERSGGIARLSRTALPGSCVAEYLGEPLHACLEGRRSPGNRAGDAGSRAAW
jgi:hypothetical protein